MPFRSLRAASALAVAAIAVAVAGCPDPQATFDDFGERYDALDPQGSTSTGPVGDCLLPEVGGAADGKYLFALSAGQLVANKPLLFDADVKIVEGASGVELDITLVPLGTPYRAIDATPMTPVGDAIPLGSYPIAADGTFTAELPPITVTGLANAISPRDLEAEVVMKGQICADVERDELVKLGFFCGSISGAVTEPIDLELEESKNSFTFLKYEGELPGEEEILYNCNGDVAAPFL